MSIVFNLAFKVSGNNEICLMGMISAFVQAYALTCALKRNTHVLCHVVFIYIQIVYVYCSRSLNNMFVM